MKKKFLLSITIIALLCIAAITAVVWKNAPVQKQKKQLELGNRYLEEMNYEQAKVVFEELITIDPSNVEAYLGAAKAYAGLENYEGAVALLWEGYEQTGSEDIKAQMEEYEKKLEEKKQEAEQALESEINDYIADIPYIRSFDRDNPIYTYSYLKKVYDEKLPQLFKYIEMDISDRTRLKILATIKECYLSINNMDKAKEYWTQCIVLSNELGLDSGQYEYDEYGRLIEFVSDDGVVRAYEYYENSCLIKTSVNTVACSSHEGSSDVWQYELEEYDEEGRILREVMHYSCGYEYDVTNVKYTCIYEANSCRRLCVSTSEWVIEGRTVSVTGESEFIETYDEEGYLIFDEDYDGDGNLQSRTEYDKAGNVISYTTY